MAMLALVTLLYSISLISASPLVHLKKRIVDGTPTMAPIPWFVSLQEIYEGVPYHFCGGSLLSETTVVTAAHCFDGYGPHNYSQIEIAANRYNLLSDSEEGVVFDIKDVFIHPHYNNMTFENDIAMVKVLPRDRTHMDKLQYIQLDGQPEIRTRKARSGDLDLEGVKNTGLDPSKFASIEEASTEAERLQGVDIDHEYKNHLFVAGWGDTFEGEATTSPILRKAQMKPNDLRTCQNFIGGDFSASTLICAVGANYDSDACQADSGGPLYYENGADLKLVGVVSFGLGCGRDNYTPEGHAIQYPGVYTRVNAFRVFIDQHLNDSNPIVRALTMKTRCARRK